MKFDIVYNDNIICFMLYMNLISWSFWKYFMENFDFVFSEFSSYYFVEFCGNFSYSVVMIVVNYDV